VGAVLLAASGCGGDRSDGEATPGTTATTEAPETPVETTTTPNTVVSEPETSAEPDPVPAPTPAPAVKTVRITVRDGRAVGGIARDKLEQGEQVVLVVRSDVADHVHLHGYDVMVDVAPGKPARLRFKATIPGRFEVELEDRGLHIAELEVRP
jgi:hypothetical protein